jgi:hypothetical protein
MEQERQILLNEISKLPFEKMGEALSFIRYLAQAPKSELLIDPIEESELRGILASGNGNFIDSSELLAKIKELPDDSICERQGDRFHLPF